MKIILPWPPSVNHYRRIYHVRGRRKCIVRAVLSKEVRAYRIEAMVAIKKQYRLHKMIEYPVIVHQWMIPPTARRYDIDNFTKAIFDALTHNKVWLDDHLVHEHHVYKRPKQPGGAIVVSIEKL